MGFVTFNRVTDDGGVFPLLINSDRIDAIGVGDDNVSVFIYTGGSENPFSINDTLDEVLGKLNNVGCECAYNKNDCKSISNEVKYKKFVNEIKALKEQRIGGNING